MEGEACEKLPKNLAGFHGIIASSYNYFLSVCHSTRIFHARHVSGYLFGGAREQKNDGKSTKSIELLNM
jgi:hypothetical protein